MPWGKWETGLPDDFDLEVSNAYFQYSPKLVGPQGEPRMALHLEGKAEGGSYDSPVQLEGDTALLFTVGDKWMAVDDGARIVHEAGSHKSFNSKSAIANLIDAAEKAGAPLRERGEPEEAKIWVGLKLHFNREDVTWGKGEDQKTSSVLRVTGYGGEGEKGAKPAAESTTTKAPAGDDVTAISDAVGGPIFKRLEKLAGTAEDYETWAAEAVELPKVKDSDEVQEIILDEERGRQVYEALKG